MGPAVDGLLRRGERRLGLAGLEGANYWVKIILYIYIGY